MSSLQVPFTQPRALFRNKVSQSLLEQITSFSNHPEMSETAGDSLRYNGFSKSQKGTKKIVLHSLPEWTGTQCFGRF
jgi:hypothetical protein